jgi:hypothetical protein
MASEWLGPANGRVFRPFPGVLANAVAARHPITQGNVTHVGCTVFPHSLRYLPQAECAYWKGHELLVFPSKPQALDLPVL